MAYDESTGHDHVTPTVKLERCATVRIGVQAPDAQVPRHGSNILWHSMTPTCRASGLWNKTFLASSKHDEALHPACKLHQSVYA